MKAAKERQFNVNGREIAAQEWRCEDSLESVPVLALHGWLDNSASFNSLAVHLTGLHLIAVDLCGHGQSSHRLDQAAYNVWEDIPDIMAVADQLGWGRFFLLGHSRGAMICVLAAGTFPERIRGLALVEGLLPLPATIAETPEQLARSITDIKAKQNTRLPVYETVEKAAKVRQRGMFRLSYDEALQLTQRGLKAVEGGYCWSTDPKLLAASAVKLTSAHFNAFMERIQAPIVLVLADEGMPKLYPGYREALAPYPDIKVVMLSGDHHLHMGAAAEQVAEVFKSLWCLADFVGES